MPDKPETKLQKAIVARFLARDAFAFKVHQSIFSKGISDVLAVYRGFFIACEVKTPENKAGATKLQRAFLKRVRRAGGYGYVIRDHTAVDAILDHIDRRIDG